MPKLRWPREFRCSPLDQQWIEDHVLAVALRAIFFECLKRSEMIQERRVKFRITDLEIYGGDAAAVAFFNDAGQLEFWSHQFDELSENKAGSDKF
jgi:hypothetical protein